MKSRRTLVELSALYVTLVAGIGFAAGVSVAIAFLASRIGGAGC